MRETADPPTGRSWGHIRTT